MVVAIPLHTPFLKKFAQSNAISPCEAMTITQLMDSAGVDENSVRRLTFLDYLSFSLVSNQSAYVHCSVTSIKATRSVIRAGFLAMNTVAAELDEYMVAIVGGREVKGLTNNA